jgi:hypothetical protein
MTGAALQCGLIRLTQVALGVMAMGLFLGATLTLADNGDREKTLLVWGGDKAHEARTSSPSSTLMAIRPTMAKSFASCRYQRECSELALLVMSRTMPASSTTAGLGDVDQGQPTL